MKYRIIRDKNIELMRHGTLRTTIKDIARYTGFSVTTISLVLNGKAKKIPKQTKDVILEAADRLNYHPNQVAVGLVKKDQYNRANHIRCEQCIFFQSG